jgi:hypothetical protein
LQEEQDDWPLREDEHIKMVPKRAAADVLLLLLLLASSEMR